MFRLQEKGKYPCGIIFVLKEFPQDIVYFQQIEPSLTDLEEATKFGDRSDAEYLKKQFDKNDKWKIVKL